MRALFAACALSLVAASVQADETPSFSDLITDSIGYMVVRPGVVLLEGESEGIHFCQIDITDVDFAAYAASGKLDQDDSRFVCIPVEEVAN